MTKFISYLAIVVILLVPTFFVMAQTQDISRPTLGIVDFKIETSSLKGKLLLKNQTSESINNVAYTFILSEKNKEVKMLKNGVPHTSVTPGALIVTKTEKVFFSILPGEELPHNFSLEYPVALPEGTYRLETRVVNLSGGIHTAVIKDISLKGSGNFLNIDESTCRLFVGSGKYAFLPNDGPNVFPGETVKIACNFSNPTANPIKTRPQVHIADYFTFGYSASADGIEDISLAEVSFKPLESKTLTFEILSSKNPQTYQARLQFYDSDRKSDTGLVSSMSFFRWVVKGKAGRIENIALNKDGYFEGELARVDVSAWASPDLYWANYNGNEKLMAEIKEDPVRFSGSAIESPMLKVSISSGSGGLCGNAVISMGKPNNRYLYVQTIEVPIKISCVDPKVAAVFLDGDKVLAEANFISRSLPATKELAKERAGFGVKFIYIFAGLSAILLLWSFIKKSRDSKSTQ